MEKIFNVLCDYGCGQQAKHQFKNGKFCCSKSKNSCPENKRMRGEKRRGKLHTEVSKEKMRISKLGEKNPNYGKPRKKEIIKKIAKSNRGKKRSSEIKKRISVETKKGMKKKEVKEKMKEIGELKKLNVEKIKEKYPFFYKIEEIRSNPVDINKVQVHCKNHNCKNSKEQGGWFTPTYIQLYERIRQLEKDYGSGGCYFYCSDECKNSCPLFNLKSDPFCTNTTSHTEYEYQIFREFVLKRDNYKCQYCGKKAEHVHHEKPQKLEPFFALDPDFAWSCCRKCHYEKGHQDECSTGNLAKKIC